MTTTFYAPVENVQGSRVILPEDEAQHASRSLRKAEGEEIAVVDGEGSWHRVRLEEIGRKKASGVILETRRDVGEPDYELTVVIGVLKSRNRFETFLEKAVECGVSRIVPVETRYTERNRIRRARAHRLMIAAMKQCGRSRLPELVDVIPLKKAVNSQSGTLLLCRQHPENATLARFLLDEKPTEASVFVGAEGGFSDQEVQMLVDNGAVAVRLAPRRLRAETAAIAAASAFMTTFA